MQKYHWIKLPTDFFVRPDIMAIRHTREGIRTLHLYLCMLCDSASTDGRLQINDRLPHNERTLATRYGVKESAIRNAIDVLTSYGLLSKPEGSLYELCELPSMVGSVTEDALRARKNREKRRGATGRSTADTDIETDKEREREREKETDTEEEGETKSVQKRDASAPPGAGGSRPPAESDVVKFFRDAGHEKQALPFYQYYAARGFMLSGSPMRDWQAAARLWMCREGEFPPMKNTKAPKERYGSFDPEEAFRKALARSYGEDYANAHAKEYYNE